MPEKNGYVKWPAFVGTILTILALVFGITSSAVSDGEFLQFEKRMDSQFKVLREDIRGLKK